jgi:hypothetical protein
VDELRRKQSIIRLAAYLSMLIAVLYVAIGVCMSIDPAERYRGEEYYQVLVEQPTVALTWRPIFIIIGILTLPVMNAVTRKVRSEDGRWEGVLQWALICGYAGCVVLAIDWMREVVGMQAFIEAIKSNDVVAQTALKLDGRLGMDPNYVWKFDGLGFWYLTVSLLGLRNKVFPKGLNIFGVIVGICLILAGWFTITDTLITIGGVQIAALQIPAALGGTLFGPIYHMWLGIAMRRDAAGMLEA